MPTYFALEQDRDTAFMAAFEEAEPGHDLKYMSGRLISPEEQPKELTVFVDDPPDTYPDFFWTIRAVFCSQRMRERLTAAGVDNVEYFPVRIVEEESGREVPGYYLMNIVARISALDRDRAKVTEWRKRITRVQSLALNDAAIGGTKVFRLHEYPGIVFVSDDVAAAVRSLPGVALRPAEGWNDAHRFEGAESV